MTEATFTRWFCKQLQATGAITLTLCGGDVRQQSNLPDRYVCHRTFRGWLEFKRGGNRLKTGQKVMLKRLIRRGDVCLVVRLRGDEIMETEDPDGRALSWTNLRPLHAMGTDAERGQELLKTLAGARDET